MKRVKLKSNSFLGLILLVPLYFSACNVKSSDDVPGDYQLVKPAGNERIRFNIDRSFTITTSDPSSGVVSEQRGTWELTTLGGNSTYVYLTPFIEEESGRVVHAKPIENWFGRIYLGSDEARLYKKMQ